MANQSSRNAGNSGPRDQDESTKAAGRDLNNAADTEVPFSTPHPLRSRTAEADVIPSGAGRTDRSASPKSTSSGNDQSAPEREETTLSTRDADAQRAAPGANAEAAAKRSPAANVSTDDIPMNGRSTHAEADGASPTNIDDTAL